jgi:hypothetical protein
LNRVALTIYGRKGCHLCEDAEMEIRRLADELPIDLLAIDIESDDRLHARFLERIPVIESDGEIWFELEVDSSRLRDRVVAAVSIAPDEHRGNKH